MFLFRVFVIIITQPFNDRDALLVHSGQKSQRFVSHKITFLSSKTHYMQLFNKTALAFPSSASNSIKLITISEPHQALACRSHKAIIGVIIRAFTGTF